jgi:hypothetical protein
MKKRFMFFFLCKICIGQNTDLTYLKLGNKENNLIIEQMFNNYDYYFIGENHDSKDLSKNKLMVLNLLNNKNNKNVYVEESVLLTNTYDLVFNILKEDTINSIFSEMASSNEYSTFLKLLYINIKANDFKNKYNIRPIDNFSADELDVKKLLRFYSNNPKSIIIKRDLSELKNINKKTSKEKQLYSYLKFYDKFKENEKFHLNYLGQTKFNELNLVLKGLESYNESIKEKGELYYKSSFRENFMFENIIYDIRKNDSLKFISFNGHFHIPLEIPSEWVGVENWQSLAYKIKIAYPEKKVCSIYLMNKNDDSLSDQYFPEEKKKILSNIKEGEIYLIQLDGEGSPFKELSKKFQYIVVW